MVARGGGLRRKGGVRREGGAEKTVIVNRGEKVNFLSDMGWFTKYS